jgi:hypothetical protein
MHGGDESYSPTGVKRALRHDADGGLIGHENRCQECGALVPVPEIRSEPGPGFEPTSAELDPVSTEMRQPRRLLEPVTAGRASRAAED